VVILTCGSCGAILPEDNVNSGEFIECRNCESPAQIHVFPAFHQPAQTVVPGLIAQEGESNCFYHEHKRAVAPCDSCGRFICSLCRVDLGSDTLCPGCIHAGIRKGKLKKLQNSVRLNDTIALWIATLPAFLFWPSLISAPLAIYWSVRYWNAPTSILPRSRARFILAVLIAGLQITGWIALGIFILSIRGKGALGD
jgi:hypothetical protein